MARTHFHALLALSWLACAPLGGAPAGPALAPLACSSTDHWTRQGRTAPWLPPPVREHGPGAGAVPPSSAFGWA
ncbi:hypothetical protein [Acidovorax sp. A1169]|uniref:hypothetical protein n=1 Tax=Acidovorax sp. A1169 TaxID=3059524 RepID=UPI00273803BF|nr:hypothetical protein [Acidovorax sp. A1169]MDP4076533.1 hypothetical protein [Acidovorax sp. A1169]